MWDEYKRVIKSCNREGRLREKVMMKGEASKSMKTCKKKKIAADRFTDTLFSWSLEDIFNQNLFKNKVPSLKLPLPFSCFSYHYYYYDNDYYYYFLLYSFE